MTQPAHGAVGAVLFEVEMVLVDTSAARRRAMRAAIGDTVLFSDEDYDRWCAWRPTREAVARLVAERAPEGDDTALDLATLRCERAVVAELGGGPVTLMPGAAECLDMLAGRVRLAIVTRATRREADAMLSRWEVGHLFEFIVTREDVAHPKPAPEGHLMVLKRLTARAAVRGRVIAVDDPVSGHEAARAAGIAVVAVGAPLGNPDAFPSPWVPALSELRMADLESDIRLAGAERE